MHDVGVGRDRVGLCRPARFRPHAGSLVPQRRDFGYRIAKPDRSAETFELGHHTRNQPIGASPRKPDAAILFKLVDEGVDRTGSHRIATDKQGMKRERLAQLFIAHIGGHDRIDRSPRLITRKRGRRLQHRGEIQKGDMAKLEIAFPIHVCGIVEEPLISRHIPGVELGNFGRQAGIVVRIVEIGPVGPVEPVEGHDGVERHVLRHIAAGKLPEFAQAIGIGDHGRSGVKGKAVLLPVIGTPARLVACLDDRGLNARRLETDGQG